MKKLTLTSIIGMLIAAPALATVGDTTFDANDTVENACVVGVTGISANNATANTTATWTPLTYSCAAGTYLPDGDTWANDSSYTSGNCAPCPANSYCPGSGNGTFTYSESGDQGINSCPAGYTSSDANSSAASQCYRSCTTSDVAHSANVTGRYYSGETAQSNSCEPASTNGCVTGYHYVAATPNLNTAIGTVSGSGDYSGTTFSVTYNNKGTITGKAQCSAQEGTNNGFTWSNPTISSTLPDSTGQYCYCQLDSYTPYNGTTQSLSAPWVFNNEYDVGHGANCTEDDCAYRCALYLRSDYVQYLAFRAAVFGSLGASPAHCDANTITISWKNASGTEHASTTCTYDGAITTPTTEPTKRGHAFAGWTFTAQ